MEKLIKLLNEYMEYKEKFWPDKLTRFKWVDTSWNLLFELKNWEYFQEEYIISKKFWFIKWLVDNDKIDLMKLKKWIEDNKFYCAKWGKTTNMLLMLLSIQDNPIEFLISILK